MKPKTIIGLVVMTAFGALLFLNFGAQVGGYMTFAEAETAGVEAHVVGTWAEDRPIHYDPAQNVFTFYMKDEAGAVRKVRYAAPKPANFAEAEKIVVQGRFGATATDEGAFVADHILVKCPSKYNTAPNIREAAAEDAKG